jgi:hypothetical protein
MKIRKLPAGSESMCCHNTVNTRVLLQILYSSLLLIGVFAGTAPAQDMFAIHNLKKQKWPEAEAKRIYVLAAEAVRREFKLERSVHPRFTLVLGYQNNELDVNSGELRLAKWDRRLFTDGVILFSMEQMLTPDMRRDLMRRTLQAADATVSVEEEQERALSPVTAPIAAGLPTSSVPQNQVPQN